MISISNVQAQATHVVDRAKIYEFFTLAASLLGFDVELISNILSEPWEREVEE